MSVRYAVFDGEQVSVEWFVFLTQARRDGWPGRLNEGHRTFARQAYFWSGSPNNPNRTWRGNLAARPSHNAPHIRTGRIDHAIDVNGSDWLIGYGARRGVQLVRTVRGESWHLEASAPQLRAFARRYGNALSFMRDDEERWVREYINLKRRNRDRDRRRVLRRVMKARRMEIWRAANGRMKGARRGWDILDRRRRYIILARYSK
jgi:hypothetical protein